MNTDARVLTTLPAHPKTKRLIRHLGDGAAWRLTCLFLWAAGNRSDGDLAGMTDEDIELAVDWQGESGALIAALVEVRFVDGPSGLRKIHDWEVHNPWAAGAKARSAKSRFAALTKHHGSNQAAAKMPEYAATLRGGSAEGGKEDRDVCKPHLRPASAASSPIAATLAVMPEPASGMPDALPEDASRMFDSASGMPVVDSGSAPLPSPSPSPSQDQEQTSLRSVSSTAAPMTVRSVKAARKAGYWGSIATDAIEAYNRILARPNGVLARVLPVSFEQRKKQVYLSRMEIREICISEFGNPAITPAFWDQYFREVKLDDFDSGRSKGGKGHENWMPGFKYLTQPDVITKHFERAKSEAPL